MLAKAAGGSSVPKFIKDTGNESLIQAFKFLGSDQMTGQGSELLFVEKYGETLYRDVVERLDYSWVAPLASRAFGLSVEEAEALNMANVAAASRPPTLQPCLQRLRCLLCLSRTCCRCSRTSLPRSPSCTRRASFIETSR